MATPRAAGGSCHRSTSVKDGHGDRREVPCGTGPTSLMPLVSARPEHCTTSVAPSMPMSGAGQVGAKRWRASSTTSTESGSTSVGTWTSARCVTAYLSSWRKESPSTWIPVTLPIWLTIMSAAMPAM